MATGTCRADGQVCVCDGCSLAGDWRRSYPASGSLTEAQSGAAVRSPDTAAREGPRPLRWGDGSVLRCQTGPAQRCRSRNHHTGGDSVERQRETPVK